ncbi:hypothetical protein ACQ4PT_043479 [Festuca glaucescens]
MVVGHPWSVYRVRDVFFFYFEENKHAQLSSTPVIPVDDTKVPLIHACLNRFKGTLNGRGSKRTCFSMRCIIVGGDDAELIDHFNNDATYHRFTEVLGSWSFGDYFKEDAIRLLFDLLCQFNRQADGVLEPLQNKHVLTGINVECLAAILQNKETHYELDVYDDVLTHISCYARREAGFYSGKIGDADTLGVDTAYRLLADHIRMIAVTNAPGSQLGLGNEGRKYFLYCADKQAVQYGHLVLEADVEKLDQERHEIIIEGILQNEEDLCPEGYKKMGKIVEDEMMIYKNTMAELRDQELPFDMGGKKKKKKDATSVVWYATRVIEFLGRRTQIILKNKDTRCSLVPLCNALLLGEKITLSLDIKKVSESHLIFLVQSYLLSQMQLEQNLELSESNKQVLGVLPKLPGSLYFDVTFGRCKDVNFFAGPSTNLLRVQDQIYVLLNDLSLLSTETDVVWERLTEENGDGLFVDCDFVPRDSKVQSILPLTKNERKKRNRKEKRGLKKKEGGRNEDRDGEKTDDEAYEKTEEKDDEKTGGER